MPTLHRSLLAIAIALAMSPTLRAAEPAPATNDADAKSDQPPPVTKKPGRGPAPIDPMQDLRERLAAKLGATRAGEGKGEQVVRVSTQPDGELQLAGNADAPRKSHAIHSAVAKPGAKDGNHWSYDGESGPQAWARLKPEFAKCASGTRQSPIDIRDGIRVDLEPVQFDYRPSAFGVIDNGHTVQVNVAPGNSIEVVGRRFELVQFHFHRPSEERIDGRQFDMVVHLVHKDADGRLAVVAVLLERGSAHPLVQTVWNNLPLEKGERCARARRSTSTSCCPRTARYFTYMGSLTTPPCSEGVLWMVMKQPVSVSPEQIDDLRAGSIR